MPIEKGIQSYDNTLYDQPLTEYPQPQAPPQGDLVGDSYDMVGDEAPKEKQPSIKQISPYTMDVTLDAPLPIPNVGGKRDEIQKPSYATIYKVTSEGPIDFSSDPIQNNEIVNEFKKQLGDIQDIFNSIPPLNKYKSQEYKQFTRMLKDHMYKFQNAYKRLLSQDNKKKDQQYLKIFQDVADNKKVGIQYSTFLKISKRLLAKLE